LPKEVTATVLSFAVTQVSVKRLFSGFRLILSDLRASLPEQSAKNIMFLRMNMEF
jgi:hypothetical protein